MLGVRGWPGTALQVLIGLVLVVLVWFAARWLRGMVQGAMSRRRVRPEVVQVISRATFIAVIVIGLFVAISSALGQGSLAASGLLAATILAALGIQDILRNYVSGVYLLTERRLSVGDQIEFGTWKGTIIEFKFRVTYLRGEAGELIVVPNSELFNNTVVVRANRVSAESDRPSVPTSEGAGPSPTLDGADRAARPSRKPRA